MAGEKRRVIGRWVAWAMVFVVVAYPLSYGPLGYAHVRWVTDEEIEDFQWLHNLYAPCHKLSESSSLYMDYRVWWIRLGMKAEVEDWQDELRDIRDGEAD